MTHAAAPASSNRKARDAAPKLVMDAVTKALTGLRFGSIQLTVHEGEVVQLDVTERQRFS